MRKRIAMAALMFGCVGPTEEVHWAGADVVLREAPRLDSNELEVVRKGERVVADGKGNEAWLSVRTESLVAGWVPRAGLQNTGGAEARFSEARQLEQSNPGAAIGAYRALIREFPNARRFERFRTAGTFAEGALKRLRVLECRGQLQSVVDFADSSALKVAFEQALRSQDWAGLRRLAGCDFAYTACRSDAANAESLDSAEIGHALGQSGRLQEWGKMEILEEWEYHSYTVGGGVHEYMMVVEKQNGKFRLRGVCFVLGARPKSGPTVQRR